MPSWLAVLIGIVVLIILVLIIRSLRKKGASSTNLQERTCKQCQKPIPDDYDKSLCPHCKGFIM